MRSLLLICTALSLACSENSISTPSNPMAAITGSWSLQAWELRDATNSARRVDRITEGFGGTLVVGETGAFTMTLTLQGQAMLPLTGTLTIHGDTLVFKSQDGEALIRYSTGGGSMTWDTLQPEIFDMDGDDVLDSVVEHMVFRRG
jgi:hypothetical protein